MLTVLNSAVLKTSYSCFHVVLISNLMIELKDIEAVKQKNLKAPHSKTLRDQRESYLDTQHSPIIVMKYFSAYHFDFSPKL